MLLAKAGGSVDTKGKGGTGKKARHGLGKQRNKNLEAGISQEKKKDVHIRQGRYIIGETKILRELRRTCCGKYCVPRICSDSGK